MAAITVLNKDNVPMGPFTREQVAEKLQSGEIHADQLAFVDGLTQWTPLRDVLARLDAPAVIPPQSSLSPAPYSYAATMQPPGDVVYAGFWLRFAAFILDYIITTIPLSIIGGIFGFIFGFAAAATHPQEKVNFVHEDGSPNIGFILLELGIMAMSITVTWLYYALLESSAGQATLGKRVLGLKVTTEAGERISFARASGRFFGKIASALILYVGFMMAGFTTKKQALHDMMAGTLVIRK